MSAPFPEGEGIFETIMTVEGVPFALSRHLSRVRRSAKRIGLLLPTEAEIKSTLDELLRSTPITTETGRLRISCFTSGEMVVEHDNFRRWSAPARVTLLDRKVDEDSPMVGIKSLPYTENLACLEIVRAAGFDEGIRLNKKGEVCEAAVSNLLLRIDGLWITPHLASGALPGVMRELLVEWFEIQERKVDVGDLENADAMFLLSSLKIAQPVSFLKERELVIDSEFMEKVAARMEFGIDP